MSISCFPGNTIMTHKAKTYIPIDFPSTQRLEIHPSEINTLQTIQQPTQYHSILPKSKTNAQNLGNCYIRHGDSDQELHQANSKLSPTRPIEEPHFLPFRKINTIVYICLISFLLPISQTQPLHNKQIKTEPEEMENLNTDDLVIKLETSLDISNLEVGPKIVGTIIAEKMPNRGAIRSILKKAWAGFGEANITFINDNVISTTIQDDAMADRIIDGGPWSVMGHCFSHFRWPNHLAVEELLIHQVTYWIQAHGIPMNLLTTANATEIGEKLRLLVAVEGPWRGTVRGFLRMQVQFDGRLPLPLGIWLPRCEGPDTWVELRFERLSDFCFNCGRLGHIQHHCSHPFIPSDDPKKAAYGEWMRTKAIKENITLENLCVPRGMRRKPGTVAVASPGMAVRRLIQAQEEEARDCTRVGLEATKDASINLWGGRQLDKNMLE